MSFFGVRLIAIKGMSLVRLGKVEIEGGKINLGGAEGKLKPVMFTRVASASSMVLYRNGYLS